MHGGTTSVTGCCASTSRRRRSASRWCAPSSARSSTPDSASGPLASCAASSKPAPARPRPVSPRRTDSCCGRCCTERVTYAGERRIVDADSHLMEWPGFLGDSVEARFRDVMPVLGGGRSGLDIVTGTHTLDERDALVALGDDLIRKGPKWHAALGAVDPSERTRALDLLGFDAQVIYSSLCAPLFDLRDPAARRAGYRAHNRAVAGFCERDRRLLGVAMCELDDVDEGI